MAKPWPNTVRLNQLNSSNTNNTIFTALDFTKNKETGTFDRGLPQGDQYCVLTFEDDDFVLLTYHKLTLEEVTILLINISYHIITKFFHYRLLRWDELR